MVKVGKWVSLTVKEDVIVRARLVPWRTEKSDGTWVDSDRIAMVIQRIRDSTDGLKWNKDEGKALAKVLQELFAEEFVP